MKTKYLLLSLFAFFVLSLEVCAQSVDYRFAFCVKDNGKWGLTDSVGNIMVPCVYDDFLPSAEGLIAAKRGDKWGFITPQGNEVITFAYESVRYFSEGMAAVRKEGGGKWGFINRKGEEVIPFEYEITYNVKNTREAFREGLVAAENSDGKWGYLDKSGNVAIPFIYNYASDFEEGISNVSIETDGQYLYGKLNKCGKYIRPLTKEPHGSRSPAVVEKKDYYGLCDSTGKIVMPIKYSMIKPHSVGKYIVEDRKGKISLIKKNRKGKYEKYCQMPNLHLYSTIRRIEKNGKCGIAGYIPPIYDMTECYILASYGYSFEFDCKRGFSIGAELVASIKYYPCFRHNDVDYFYDCGDAKDRKMHLYPYRSGFDDGNFMISVMQDQKWGFICLFNEVNRIPCEYDDKDFFASVYANVRRPKKPEYMHMCVKKDGKWGVINMKGTAVVPLKYQDVKTICY